MLIINGCGCQCRDLLPGGVVYRQKKKKKKKGGKRAVSAQWSARRDLPHCGGPSPFWGAPRTVLTVLPPHLYIFGGTQHLFPVHLKVWPVTKSGSSSDLSFLSILSYSANFHFLSFHGRSRATGTSILLVFYKNNLEERGRKWRSNKNKLTRLFCSGTRERSKRYNVHWRSRRNAEKDCQSRNVATPVKPFLSAIFTQLSFFTFEYCALGFYFFFVAWCLPEKRRRLEPHLSAYHGLSSFPSLSLPPSSGIPSPLPLPLPLLLSPSRFFLHSSSLFFTRDFLQPPPPKKKNRPLAGLWQSKNGQKKKLCSVSFKVSTHLAWRSSLTGQRQCELQEKNAGRWAKKWLQTGKGHWWEFALNIHR